MSKPEISVIGDRELINALKAFDEKASSGLEGVTHAGAGLVTGAAAKNAPHRSGNLSDQIKQETLEKSDSAVEVGVGPDDREAFYGLFLELGVDAHHVTPAVKKALQIEGGFAASADHQGIPAQPFLRPALDENIDAVVEAIGEELRELLGLDL